MRTIFERLGKVEIRGAIALLSILGSFLFLFRLMRYPVPKENETLINIIAGALIVGSISNLMGYYFGTSKQSVDESKITKSSEQ